MAWQRVTREFSDDQLWSLDYTLARLTVRGVQNIRKWKSGYPSEFSSAHGNGGGWEAWDAILGQIEAGFQAWLDADGWIHNDPVAEQKFQAAMSLYAEWFSALWD